MEKVTIARQYAKALFDSCKEGHLVDRVASELETMNEQLRTETEIRALLIHPEIPFEEKRKILKQLIPKGLSSETVAFMNLLLEHRLLELLPDVHQAFAHMRLEVFGILKALIETPRPLTSALKEQLRTALASATGREILVEEELNPALIGGVRIQVGDRILDASIAGRLNRIREKIVAGGE
jgi:F-type H+-transporting ATPase subunit delta